MSRLKRRYGEHRGIIPNTNSTNKKVFCPLCQDVQMTYEDLKQVWSCGLCGHTSDPRLSQISLTKSELKASNDPWHSRQKVFFGNGERQHRRIDSPSFSSSSSIFNNKSNVYSSLMAAEEATNIHQDPEELD
jgi:ribosomal protein S27E